MSLMMRALRSQRCYHPLLKAFSTAAVDESIRFQNGVHTNFVGAINNALDNALSRDDKVCLFGEDVAFGGVFRASNVLLEKYGKGMPSPLPRALSGCTFLPPSRTHCWASL